MTHNTAIILIIREDSMDEIWLKHPYGGPDIFHSAYFEVDAAQLRGQIPSIAEKITAQNRSVARVMVYHASVAGNFNDEYGLKVVNAFNPDIIFCCHPSETRRTYPTLPIFGWHEGRVKYVRKGNVVSIGYNQD